MAELAIRARWALVESDGQAELVADRWVVVEGGHIAAVVPGRPVATRLVDRPDPLHGRLLRLHAPGVADT